MKECKQLNTAKEFGGQPRQQHRYYSIYGGGVCLQAQNTGSGIMKILGLYEK
nr:MAG TPA: hypothetical protein [Caudoviricetes sp.]